MKTSIRILGSSSAFAVALLVSGAAAQEDFTAVVTRLQKEKPAFANHPAPYYTDNLMHNLRVEVSTRRS